MLKAFLTLFRDDEYKYCSKYYTVCHTVERCVRSEQLRLDHHRSSHRHRHSVADPYAFIRILEEERVICLVRNYKA